MQMTCDSVEEVFRVLAQRELWLKSEERRLGRQKGGIKNRKSRIAGQFV